MTAYECFKLAEQIELLSQTLYTQLATHPGTPRPIQLEFLALADEEGNHASRIRLLAATSRGSPALQDVARRAGDGLLAVVAELEVAIEETRANRQAGDLVMVLDRLIDLEQRFAWVHTEALAGCAALHPDGPTGRPPLRPARQGAAGAAGRLIALAWLVVP
jgi:hypothetical protein